MHKIDSVYVDFLLSDVRGSVRRGWKDEMYCKMKDCRQGAALASALKLTFDGRYKPSFPTTYANASGF